MTEQELIRGCIKKDRRSQNALYEKYYPLMSSIALRYCPTVEDAQQGVNYGFLKVLQHIKNYKEDFALATWIRNILVNHLIDEFRKNQHYQSTMYAYDPQEMEEGYDLNLAEDKWETDQLRKMLSGLPDVTQKVFNLYAIDGYKHREIAKLLEISEGTSKWHVSDARRRLRKMLNDHITVEKKRIEITR